MSTVLPYIGLFGPLVIALSVMFIARAVAARRKDGDEIVHLRELGTDRQTSKQTVEELFARADAVSRTTA